MTEYTPTIRELRRAYQLIFVETRQDIAGAEFDRALAAHDAEVRARSLADAANRYRDEVLVAGGPTPIQWLRTLADSAGVVAEEPKWEPPRTFPTPDKRDDDGIGLLGGAPRW
ncbi:hypothetical protein [Microbacterium maritypicum]